MEEEKSLKVKKSTHQMVMAEKLTCGYKSVDELIKERVFNGNNGSIRATKGIEERGAHPVDQPGKNAARDHTQNQARGQSAESGTTADSFVIE